MVWRVRILVITIVVLVVLLIGADRMLAYLADRGLAQAVQASAGLEQEPSVTVHGFPLLTQALRGKYERVDGSANDLRGEDGLEIQRLDLSLTGLRVPISSLLSKRVNEIPVDSARARGLITYDALNAAARERITIPNLTFQFSQGTEGRIAVSGTYSGVIDATLTGEAAVRVQNGQLVVRPEATTLDGVPAFISGPLIQRLSGKYDLPPFPFGFQATEVTVGDDGVTVVGSADDAVLKTQ